MTLTTYSDIQSHTGVLSVAKELTIKLRHDFTITMNEPTRFLDYLSSRGDKEHCLALYSRAIVVKVALMLVFVYDTLTITSTQETFILFLGISGRF